MNHGICPEADGFQVTFICHQGWLVRHETTSLLIDPLLTDTFGHGGSVGVVFPPRACAPERFPRVSAVLLTHEHEDHFDIPSLTRVERGIPILLSRGASVAARTILHEMGHTVVLVEAGERVTLGSLEIFLFAPDHVHAECGDEWEVLQFFIRDLAGNGNFVSGVDAHFSPRSLATLARLCPSPGIVGLANNAVDFSCLDVSAARRRAVAPSAFDLSATVLEELAHFSRHWGMPQGVLFCGGGFSFLGERAWLNHTTFPCDSGRMADMLRATAPELTFLAPNPGATVRMRRGRVASVDEASDFLWALPASEWPSRAFRPSSAPIEDYAPLTGRREFSESDLPELLLGLRDFASFLYGGPLFRSLYSSERARFVFSLRTGGSAERVVLEYQPQACGFARVRCGDPMKELASGIECWASDLLALFRGEFGPTGLAFGRGLSWSQPSMIPVRVTLLWNYFHPLRRPEAFLGLYRRLLRRDGDVSPTVRGVEPRETFEVKPMDLPSTDGASDGDELARLLVQGA